MMLNLMTEPFKEDNALSTKMGFKCSRMTISWTRIFPNGDEQEPDEEGLDFYDKVLDDMIRNGIEPVLTISHYDMPLRLVKEYGSWGSKLVAFFERYVRVLFERFSSKVKYWITFTGISQLLAIKICRENLPETKVDCRILTLPESPLLASPEDMLLVLA